MWSFSPDFHYLRRSAQFESKGNMSFFVPFVHRGANVYHNRNVFEMCVISMKINRSVATAHKQTVPRTKMCITDGINEVGRFITWSDSPSRASLQITLKTKPFF